MIECEWSVERICAEMHDIYGTVIDFRTEGEGECDHKVSIRDCLLGLQMAFKHLPSLKLSEFNVEDLLWMEQPQNGDLNWIVPGQLLALAGPTEQNWPVAKFVEYAEKHRIGAMVRLNRPHYPAQIITQTGKIEHCEMFMHDGTNPTAENVRDFINLADRITGNGAAVAVHCRAGLGRTGTMIGAYLLFKYARDQCDGEQCFCGKMSPKQVSRAIIGFLRIMRPGSVLSGQPEFLESIASLVMQSGAKNDTSMIDSFDYLDCDDDSIECSLNEASTESVSVSLRASKRLKMSSTGSLKTRKSSKAPISHAGRGHAAEKHSSVHVEKI
jgi:hypothetical protein